MQNSNAKTKDIDKRSTIFKFKITKTISQTRLAGVTGRTEVLCCFVHSTLLIMSGEIKFLENLTMKMQPQRYFDDLISMPSSLSLDESNILILNGL